MSHTVQEVFQRGYEEYIERFNPSTIQKKAASDIMKCKTGELGYFNFICLDCGHEERRPRSCRNRHCPSCQSVPREKWIDQRKSEIFDDVPYFHVIMTVPHQLLPVFIRNQKLLYSLLHRCSSDSIIELSRSNNGIGGTPCITQLLHTWGNMMTYHPHIHAIVSGVGLSPDKQLVRCKESFLFPIPMLMRLFRGKFLHHLNELYQSDSLVLPEHLNHLAWLNLMERLHNIDWAPFIKETFNGNGNAIDYLGRYTHRVAISNSRIKVVTDTHITFAAFNYKTMSAVDVTLPLVEFIRRFLLHILPKGVQKIRHSGLLNNRFKRRNLNLLAFLLNKKLREAKLKGLSLGDMLLRQWEINISICPVCHRPSLVHASLPFNLLLKTLPIAYFFENPSQRFVCVACILQF